MEMSMVNANPAGFLSLYPKMPFVKEIQEGKVKICTSRGVFYNPHMELCRDLSSLCVGAIGGRLSVADVMCATGVRGLRYRKENKNVRSLHLSDISAKAVACARKNAKLNKIRCQIKKADACIVLRENSFDFVELDPFGSPQPFLHCAALSLCRLKKGYLSVTATDMPVLCGTQHSACIKNYGAIPLNNEFCHENAARILVGRAIMEFAPFNLSATPIFTLSHRHYIKIVLTVSRSASKAVEAVKSLGFISYCHSCCWRVAEKLPSQNLCPHCQSKLQKAGPMYLGKLWDGEVIPKMLLLNAQRKTRNSAQAEKILDAIRKESEIEAQGYYDLHTLAKKNLSAIIAIDKAILMLQQAGFQACRTHFCPTAIRTNAPHAEVARLVKK
ncbi:MAG: tRNA (guanine(10)-N(2))-dimethyltransferase [Candidatus Anstonellaceae archaeon]